MAAATDSSHSDVLKPLSIADAIAIGQTCSVPGKLPVRADLRAAKYKVVRQACRALHTKMYRRRDPYPTQRTSRVTLAWLDRVDMSDMTAIPPGRVISHFPGMILGGKAALAKHFQDLAKALGRELDFIPTSFILPADRHSMRTWLAAWTATNTKTTRRAKSTKSRSSSRARGKLQRAKSKPRERTTSGCPSPRRARSVHSSSGLRGRAGSVSSRGSGASGLSGAGTLRGPPFIVKPAIAAQGCGIELEMHPVRLLSSSSKAIARATASDRRSKREAKSNKAAGVETALTSRPVIAQRYETRPRLLHGFKFDLRVYVLLAGICPHTGQVQAFIAQPGLARLATVHYTPPAANNAKQRRMHLTNYSVNKSHMSKLTKGDIEAASDAAVAAAAAPGAPTISLSGSSAPDSEADSIVSLTRLPSEPAGDDATAGSAASVAASGATSVADEELAGESEGADEDDDDDEGEGEGEQDGEAGDTARKCSAEPTQPASSRPPSPTAKWRGDAGLRTASGSKWGMQPALEAVAAEAGVPVQDLWRHVRRVCALTLASITPQLVHSYASAVSAGKRMDDGSYTGTPPLSQAFEVLGLDILLAERPQCGACGQVQPSADVPAKCLTCGEQPTEWSTGITAVLLEVNRSPSMRTDAHVDTAIKRLVVADAFRMVANTPSSLRAWQSTEPRLAGAGVPELRAAHAAAMCAKGTWERLLPVAYMPQAADEGELQWRSSVAAEVSQLEAAAKAAEAPSSTSAPVPTPSPAPVALPAIPAKQSQRGATTQGGPGLPRSRSFARPSEASASRSSRGIALAPLTPRGRHSCS